MLFVINPDTNVIDNNDATLNGSDDIQRSRYALASGIIYADLLEVGEEVAADWMENKTEYEKIMNKGAYTKKITNCLKSLGITSNKKEHIGRDTAPAIMDIEEVCGLDQRNMGNWASDVYQKCYSKRLPLGALRALAGFSKTRGKYKNPRTSFKGEVQHELLAKQIFPWIDAIMSNKEINSYETSKGFLVLLRNLRWVILQDAAILIKVHDRKHVIFNTFPDIFDSVLFNDYAVKLQHHMDQAIDPNDINIETVLPGVIQKFDEQLNSLKEIKADINLLKTDISRENIKADLSHNMKAEFKLFSNHIGNALACYGENKSIDVTKTPILQEQVMQDTHTNLVLFGNKNALSTQHEINQQMEIAPMMDLVPTIDVDNSQYNIPQKFDTVQNMIEHWDMYVIPELAVHKSKWRRHLKHKDTKRFSRLKRIIDKIDKMVERGGCKEDIVQRFEDYYSRNKRVFSKLADDFVKNI